MIRKLVGFASIVTLAFAFTACGSSSTSSEDDECTKHPDSEMCQEVDEGDDVIEVDEATDPIAL